MRGQTRADPEEVRFDLLAWQDPRGGDGPASPFRVQDGMTEAAIAPGAAPAARCRAVAAGGRDRAALMLTGKAST